MRNYFIYLVATALLLFAAGCEKGSEFGPNEGGIAVRLSEVSTRAVSTEGVTIDDCTVYIYEKTDGAEPTLIRKYAPGECPSTIKLLAGSYTARVQWGEAPDVAAFDKCLYEGTADFAVTAGRTEQLAVHCYPQSAVVQVTFAYMAKDVTDYVVDISLLNTGSAASGLTFDRDETGYFTIPEEGGWLEWAFSGNHTIKGHLYKSSRLAVEGGKKYGLVFRYSEDLPGYIQIEVISVDLSEERHDDLFVFNKQPEVRGDLFSGTPEYADEAMTLTMAATSTTAELRRGDIYLLGTQPLTRAGAGQHIFHWGPEMGAQGERNHVQWELVADGRELNITLNPDFFNFPIGETQLRFEVEDTNDNTGEKIASILMNRGIRMVGTGDYDLWTNTFTARGLSTGSVPTFKLRKAGTETWRELPGVAGADGEYTAVFTPEWEESYNEQAGAAIYRPVSAQSVYANNLYELVAVIDGHEYMTTFDTTCDQPIPYADMSDSSLSCFTMNHGSFWDSGNLSILGGLTTAWLCVQDEKRDASGKTWKCAHLQAGEKAGLLSAGNLFTGSFDAPSLTAGTVSFGMDYDWQARPTALHVKCCAEIGAVSHRNHELETGGYPLEKGEQDISVIYVAIVDWDQPHKVTSGTAYPSGMWSPAETTDPGEGAVIGYGLVVMDKGTGSVLEDMEIPIYYYDKVAKPSKNLKIVISSSTSYYGDYMVGCKDNNMWLTDFSWVY